jgi:hypothetical protein
MPAATSAWKKSNWPSTTNPDVARRRENPDRQRELPPADKKREKQTAKHFPQETLAVASKAKAVVIAGRRVEVSLYDRASSMLLALLFSIGLVASVLFILWLSSKIMVPPAVAVDTEIIEVSEDGEGGGDGRAAGGSQLDTPSEEPFVGHDKETTDIQQDLSALGSAVSSKVLDLDDPDFVQPTRKGSYGTGGGIYGGFGDGRGLGHGPGKPGWPRHWEVNFAKNTIEAYAAQLDFFEIELGVLMPDNKIIYVFHLKQPRPDTRVVSNPAASEKRYYLTWTRGEMQQADRELLSRAGVDPEDHLILKFLPRKVERDLMNKERAYNNVTPKEIRLTRFGVQTDGAGFQFIVIEQSLKR